VGSYFFLTKINKSGLMFWTDYSYCISK